jgi:hypothetical protein
MEAGKGGRVTRVMAAVARATRILKGKPPADLEATVSEALLEGPEEQALHAAYRVVAAQARKTRQSWLSGKRSTGTSVMCPGSFGSSPHVPFFLSGSESNSSDKEG